MSFEEILAEVGEEKAAVITAHVESLKLAERKIGIDASKKKGAENTKLIAETARLKDAIREAAGIEDFGDDPAETIRQSIAALKTVKPNNAAEGDAIKVLETKFQKQMADMKNGFTTQLAEKDKATEQAQTKFRNAKITSQLSEAMNGKFKAHDLAIKDWIREGKVKLDENDQVVFTGQDETETIDTKKYLESFAKERSDLVISQQIPGGGSAGNRVDVSRIKQISMDQFTQLSIPDQSAFMKGGGKILEQQ
ncbi:MAG: hypothetical protein IMZ53_15725 [Thermoplasmata archaeon]|nr:hypothetical protein [Thermoplasmata archaeon]